MKKIFRSTTDSRLTGICGGIAQYLGVDSTLIRLVLVISAFFSFGTTVLLYFIASLLIPKESYLPYS